MSDVMIFLLIAAVAWLLASGYDEEAASEEALQRTLDKQELERYKKDMGRN